MQQAAPSLPTPHKRIAPGHTLARLMYDTGFLLELMSSLQAQRGATKLDHRLQNLGRNRGSWLAQVREVRQRGYTTHSAWPL